MRGLELTELQGLAISDSLHFSLFELIFDKDGLPSLSLG